MFKNLIITSFLAAFMSVGVYAKEPAVAHTSAEWQIWAYSTGALARTAEGSHRA